MIAQSLRQQFDLSSLEDTSDARILRGMLDSLMLFKKISGYEANLIPQFGEKQGQSVLFGRHRSDVPESIIEQAKKLAENFDTSEVSTKRFERQKVSKFYMCISSISRRYDINIGCIILVSYDRLQVRTIDLLLKFYESIISTRKKSIAYSHQSDFLKLKFETRSDLDRGVGKIIHETIRPNETIIFTRSDVIGRPTVSFSSNQNEFSIQSDTDPVSIVFNTVKSITVQDVSNYDIMRDNNYANISNIDFLGKNEYNSFILQPVFQNRKCYSVIGCYFKRPNAISRTEYDILSNYCTLLSEYYRLWYERQVLEDEINESRRIYGYVRQSLLIADIMHDASEDLITARGQITLLAPRTDAEKIALDAAKDSLKSLINASRHFRSFFSNRSGSRKGDPNTIRKSMKDHFEAVGVHKICNDIGNKYRAVFEKQKIEFRNTCPIQFTFLGIRYNIRRAIDNAVRNAIAHLEHKSHTKRQIIVSLRGVPEGKGILPETKHVEITIYDNGMGIEKDLLHRVTEPFFSSRGGMGLGIPIMKAACEAHGGDMKLESEWGEYCRVRLAIPHFD